MRNISRHLAATAATLAVAGGVIFAATGSASAETRADTSRTIAVAYHGDDHHRGHGRSHYRHDRHHGHRYKHVVYRFRDDGHRFYVLRDGRWERVTEAYAYRHGYHRH